MRHCWLLVLLCLVGGCRTTTVRVETEPPGAMVHYDYKPKGTTPVEFEVDWYGKHKITLDHPGYGRRIETIDLDAPIHNRFPVDFFTDLLPYNVKDRHEFFFDLKDKPVSSEEDGSGES